MQSENKAASRETSGIHSTGRRPRVLRPFSLCTWAVLLLVGLLAAGTCSAAETNAVSRPQKGQRYLVIIETSKVMDRRSDNVFRLVNALVNSRFKDQIHDGDTLGIWTYNEALLAGHFPLQKWATENQKSIASGVATFVKGQKYEKAAKFDRVLPALARLAQQSDKITFLIISSGQDAISGTPYDEKINNSFSGWKDEQQKSKMPMLTIIRASKGQFAGCTAAPAQWDVEFPSFPKEVAATNAPPPPISVAPATPPAIVAPLIVHGNRSSVTATAVPSTIDGGDTRTSSLPAAANSSDLTKGAPATYTPIPKFGVDSLPTPRQPAPENLAANATAPEPPASKVSPLTTPVAAREIQPAAEPPQTAKPSAEPVKSTQPKSAAVATPGLFSHKTLWFSAGAAFALLIVTVVLFARRSVHHERVSLITRSFERRGK